MSRFLKIWLASANGPMSFADIRSQSQRRVPISDLLTSIVLFVDLRSS